MAEVVATSDAVNMIQKSIIINTVFHYYVGPT